MKVVEAMHGAAGDDEDVAGLTSASLLHDQGENALEPVGGLLVALGRGGAGLCPTATSNSNTATEPFDPWRSTRQRIEKATCFNLVIRCHDSPRDAGIYNSDFPLLSADKQAPGGLDERLGTSKLNGLVMTSWLCDPACGDP